MKKLIGIHSKDKEETIKVTKKIGKIVDKVPKVYDDGLRPMTQESGKTLALIPRTINAALAPLRQWIAQKEYNVAETEKLLAIKLENIDKDKIVSPESYVAVPAIQALSYSMNSAELREMYANLLASSMVIDTKNNVHPSYVEIIKQLSPDEAKLLKTLGEKGDDYPLIDINMKDPEGGYVVEVHNFTPIAEGICENPNHIFSYLDNLERLKMIEIPFGVHLKNDELYIPLTEHPEIKKIMNIMLPEGYSREIHKGKFMLTQYGKDFISVCINSIF